MKKVLNSLKFLVLITFFSGFLSSCVNLHPSDGTPVSPVGLIPKDFNWKTVKELSLTIRVSSIAGIGDNMIRIIKIFNSPLLNDGALMASGAATPSSPYVVSLTLATALPTIYIQEILPTGERIVKTVDVSVTALTISFSVAAPVNDQITSKASPSPTIAIPKNYDVTIDNQASLTLTGFAAGVTSTYGNTYKSYLIPSGKTRTGSIDFGNWLSHAILYVEGTYKVTNNAALNNASIVVLNGGWVEVNGITTGTQNANTVTLDVESGGTLVSSGTIQISNGKSIVNKGTMTLSENLNVTTTSYLYNEGTLVVKGTKKAKTIFVTNHSYFYNSSSVRCDATNFTDFGSMLNDEGASLETVNWYQSTNTTTNNRGHIVATTEFKTNGNSYEVNNFCNINTYTADLQGGTYNLYEGSLFNSQILKPNNITINMTGGSIFLTVTISNIYNMQVLSKSAGYSLFKCTGNIPDLKYAASAFNGNIELVHTHLVAGSSGTNGSLLYPSALFTNGAILSQTQTKNILATTCNGAAGQIETPPPVVINDADGDGIPAGVDYADNDPNVAFASYYPDKNTWGTYLFEDMWPIKGDYDVNDLVIGFRITYLSNASNLVTSMQVDYNLRAAGTTYNLAAAFQLDSVQASNIASVTGQDISGSVPFAVDPNGNGTETGVLLAVIPLFNNTKNIVPYTGFLNTVSGTSVTTLDKYVLVKFKTPVAQTDLANSKFNMFMVVNERGREVHLPTYNATSKFDKSLTEGGQFLTGNIFKYTDGMMWGLMIPEPFAYPSERSVITSAYLHFGEWAISGGERYPDWYMQKAGYTNDAFIY